ncbi:MAG: hypothetical protein AABY93_10275 [Bacteroidota bacterium]
MKSLSTRIDKISILAVIASACLFHSCEKDDPVTVDPLVGEYKFSSATLTADTGIPSLTAGTDVTAIISSGLFSVLTCTSATNSAIELRGTKELFFTCISESKETKGGTWFANTDETELTLNFSAPPFPQPFSLIISEVNFSGSTLTGKISNLPLPADLVPGAPSGTIIVLFNITIKFQKQ